MVCGVCVRVCLQVQVPVVGVVENMAYFKCGDCDKEHLPFGPGPRTPHADCPGVSLNVPPGPGYLKRLTNDFGITASCRLPILECVAAGSDQVRL